ncbi:MAG: tail fiber domain-containing protein [Candidatus Paceibacterota bacterium]
MRFLSLILIVSSLFVLLPITTFAFNQQINYQGKMTTALNVNVPDGNYSIVFSFYTVSSGGSNIWTETQTVAVTNGLFSVMLGSVTPLTSVNFNQTLYLGVKVGADNEMTPRKTLGAVPSAFEADKLDGFESSAFFKLASTTDDLTEGVTNKFYSTVLFASSLAGTTTDALAEGLTNKYYSDTLVNTLLNASSTLAKGSCASNELLKWSGSGWVCAVDISGGGSGGIWWATSTDNLVGFTSGLNTGYAIVIGSSATTSNVKFEVVGNAKISGDLSVTGTASSSVASSTYFRTTYATATNATSTNFYSSILSAVSGWFTNLTATNLVATNATTTSATSTNSYISNSLTVSNLTGLLQANNGLLSSSSTLSIAYGGTGLSTAPTYGQLLVGNATGGYTLTATSGLNISAAADGANGQLQFNNGGVLGASSNLYWDNSNKILGIATATQSGTIDVNYINRAIDQISGVDTYISMGAGGYTRNYRGGNTYISAGQSDSSDNDRAGTGGNVYIANGGDKTDYTSYTGGHAGSITLVAGGSGEPYGNDGIVYIGNPSGQKNASLRIFGSATTTALNIWGTASTTRLLATNDIGIGTTTPNALLTIGTPTNTATDFFRIGTSTNQNILLVDKNGNMGIGSAPQAGYKAKVSGAMYVTGDLNVGGTLSLGGLEATYATTTNATTTNLYASGSIRLASLTGLLQANNGLISSSSTLSIVYGGTGLSTAPTYGQLLLGNASGGYTLTATSGLNIAASAAGATGQIQYNNGGAMGASGDLFWDNTNKILGLATSTSNGFLGVRYINGGDPKTVFYSSTISATSTYISSGRTGSETGGKVYLGMGGDSFFTGAGGAGGTVNIVGGGAGGNNTDGGAGGTVNLAFGGNDGPGESSFGIDGTVNIGNPMGQKTATLNVYGTASTTNLRVTSGYINNGDGFLTTPINTYIGTGGTFLGLGSGQNAASVYIGIGGNGSSGAFGGDAGYGGNVYLGNGGTVSGGGHVAGRGGNISMVAAGSEGTGGLDGIVTIGSPTWSNATLNVYGTASTTRLLATNDIGISTTTPWGKLSINPNGITGPSFVIGSSTATNLIVTNGGYIGIGTPNPNSLFSVGSGSKFQIDGSGNATTSGRLTLSGVSSAASTTRNIGTLNIGWTSTSNNNVPTYSNIGNSNDQQNNGLFISNHTWNGGATQTGSMGYNWDTMTDFLSMGPGFSNGGGAGFRFIAGSRGVNQTAQTRLIIDPIGNIGVGTTSTFAKFSIQNTYGSIVPLFDIATSTSAAYATSSIFRINADGSVGIGTTTPNALLTIGTPTNTATDFFRIATSTNQNILIVDKNGNIGIGGAPQAGFKTKITGAFYVTGDLTVDGALSLTSIDATTASFTNTTSNTLGVGTTSVIAQFAASSTSLVAGIFDQRGTSDIFQLQDAGANVLVVRDGGNVGIGTSTPATKLDVYGDTTFGTGAIGTDSILAFASSSVTKWVMGHDVTNGSFTLSTSTLGTNNVFMADYTTGNVAIGTSTASSSSKFLVYPSASVWGGVLASSGAWMNSSDLRLKKDIVNLDSSLDILMKLRPVRYNWKTENTINSATNHIGFIAQEVETLLPELVSEANGYKGLSYAEFSPLIVGAVQEQQKQIESIRAQLGLTATTTIDSLIYSTDELNNISLSATDSASQSLFDKISQGASLTREFISAKVVAMVGLFDRVKTKWFEVEKGVTFKDKSTGEFYCLYVDNGQQSTVKGTCEEVFGAPVPTDNTGSGDTSSTTPDTTTPPVATSTDATASSTDSGLATDPVSNTETTPEPPVVEPAPAEPSTPPVETPAP